MNTDKMDVAYELQGCFSIMSSTSKCFPTGSYTVSTIRQPPYSYNSTCKLLFHVYHVVIQKCVRCQGKGSRIKLYKYYIRFGIIPLYDSLSVKPENKDNSQILLANNYLVTAGLHDNAKPYVGKEICEPIISFDWETSVHPQDLSNITPCNYHLFHSSSNFQG